MQVHTWSVWHTYSSLFEEAFYSLHPVAHSLVASGVAPFVYASDGEACWRVGERVESGQLGIEMRSHASRGEIILPPAAGEYEAQCAFMAGAMRIAERTMMNESRLVETPYVRAFLDAIHIRSGEGEVRVFPQVKLYANGVFLTHFVVYSPDGGSTLSDLVNRYENLFQLHGEWVDMSPSVILAAESIADIAPRIGRRHRKAALAALRERRIQVEKDARPVTDGDFEFLLTAMPSDEMWSPPQSTEFDKVRGYVTAAVEWAANQNGEGVARIDPERGRMHKVAGYWVCRPTVFLIDYEGQPESATARDPRVREAATAVLTRSGGAGPHLAAKNVGRDLRQGGDYCLFMNIAVTLVAFSRTGREMRWDVPDPNYGDLVYEKLAFVEAIDYQRLSHVRMLGLSAMPKKRLSDALEERGEIDYLYEWLQPSNFGEVNSVMSYAQNLFGLAGMRERIIASGALGKEDYVTRRSTSIAALALAITVVFACASAPSIADAFFRPVFEHYGWISSAPSVTTLLIVNLATLIVTLGIAGLIWWRLYRRL